MRHLFLGKSDRERKQNRQGAMASSVAGQRKNRDKFGRFIQGHVLSTKSLESMRRNLMGEKNPRWKGGRSYRKGSYVGIMDKEHIKYHKNRRYLGEHALVMEKHLGRTLGRYEVVHHKNGDKSDNKLRNLELMTRSEHSRIHAIGNQNQLKYPKGVRVCYSCKEMYPCNKEFFYGASRNYMGVGYICKQCYRIKRRIRSKSS